MTDDTTPEVPPRVRGWLYVAGTVLGLGVAPSLVAYGLNEAAAAAAAFAGACNLLARVNTPTKAS